MSNETELYKVINRELFDMTPEEREVYKDAQPIDVSKIELLEAKRWT